MNEFLAICKDVLTGALAITAIPGFLWFIIRNGKKAFRG